MRTLAVKEKMSRQYAHKYPIAKNDYFCNLCGKGIFKGERYSYEKIRWQHKFYARRMHIPCANIVIEYCEKFGGDALEVGLVKQHLRDKHCSHCERNDKKCKNNPFKCKRIMNYYRRARNHNEQT